MVLRRSRKLCLYINTKDQKIIVVSLKRDGEVVKSLSEENEYGSQVLLPLIEKLLRTCTPGVQVRSQTERENWKILEILEGLEGIEVETGPGSFTGIRVGVAVANALGYSLNIPVNGKKAELKILY